MKFMAQQEALSELNTLRLSDRHSVLIEGPEGCGKTYLAMQYAELLHITDFQLVTPKVDEIKLTLDACAQLSNPVVLCIENLDTGVAAASYVLLKFLEEPTPNVYIVVTCRNIKHVPDTVISRSAVVVTAPPVDRDLTSYAMHKNQVKFDEIKFANIWRCVKTFKDADQVLELSDAQLQYFNNLSKLSKFNDTVSNLVWKLGHYDDNTDAPVTLVIRYLMDLIHTNHIRRVGVDCLNDLSSKRVATHAVLAKFVFEVKYCE